MDVGEINKQVVTSFRENNGHGSLGPVHFENVVLLTTNGRRSGRPHTVPLGYLRDRDDLILFASNMGAPRHPDWYLNIVANAHVRVELTDRTFEAEARVTSGAERDEAYAKLVAAWPHVAGHQEQAGRVIPMVKVPLPGSRADTIG
jgi:deazaflavin-dependent oxidoreductase (nitroreductase family)